MTRWGVWILHRGFLESRWDLPVPGLRLSSQNYSFSEAMFIRRVESHIREVFWCFQLLKKPNKPEKNNWTSEAWNGILVSGRESYDCLVFMQITTLKYLKKVLLALCNMTKQSLLIKNYATFFPLVICVHFWNLCKIKGFFKGTPYLRYFLKVSICLAGNTVVSDLFLSPSNTVMCS